MGAGNAATESPDIYLRRTTGGPGCCRAAQSRTRQGAAGGEGYPGRDRLDRRYGKGSGAGAARLSFPDGGQAGTAVLEAGRAGDRLLAHRGRRLCGKEAARSAESSDRQDGAVELSSPAVSYSLWITIFTKR